MIDAVSGEKLIVRIIFLREFAPGPQSTPAAPLPTPPASGSSTPRDNARSRDPRKEAFVPENVYDAMKENKRFDSMRVSLGHQSERLLADYSVGIRKMRKNISASF